MRGDQTRQDTNFGANRHGTNHRTSRRSHHNRPFSLNYSFTHSLAASFIICLLYNNPLLILSLPLSPTLSSLLKFSYKLTLHPPSILSRTYSYIFSTLPLINNISSYTFIIPQSLLNNHPTTLRFPACTTTATHTSYSLDILQCRIKQQKSSSVRFNRSSRWV